MSYYDINVWIILVLLSYRMYVMIIIILSIAHIMNCYDKLTSLSSKKYNLILSHQPINMPTYIMIWRYKLYSFNRLSIS